MKGKGKKTPTAKRDKKPTAKRHDGDRILRGVRLIELAMEHLENGNCEKETIWDLLDTGTTIILEALYPGQPGHAKEGGHAA